MEILLGVKIERIFSREDWLWENPFETEKWQETKEQKQLLQTFCVMAQVKLALYGYYGLLATNPPDSNKDMAYNDNVWLTLGEDESPEAPSNSQILT